jgi:hypothetical protein
MNFDYFVERADILTEMARPTSIFGNFPQVKDAYVALYAQIKNSGDVNPSQTSQIRNRLYNFTEVFLNQQDESVMDYYKSIATNSNTRFANWAKIMDTLLNEGKIDPNQLITFWNSIFEGETGEASTEDGNESTNEDSQMLDYISSDDTNEVERLNSNLRIGVNRRMKELTSSGTYPMSYLQYTKLTSYLEPRLRQALNESRKLKKSQNPESQVESSETNLQNPYEDVQGWIQDAAETLREGILSYKELYDSGEIEMDEIVDESGRPDKLAQILVMWKRENFEKSLSDIVTSFANLKNKPSPDKFMEKMVSLSDQMADAGNKSASALFMALGREFKELYETEAPEDYTETSEQPYIGFDIRVLKKIFQGDGGELFKAWYEFRKALQDFNMERLDFRRSNNLMDAKEKLRAHVAGENIPKYNDSGLMKAIIRQRNVIANMKDAGEDTTKEELRLQKMEASLGQEKSPEPKQQKNPYQKTIDDLQVKIQTAEEQLQHAEPEYAIQLKQSIARMNAALESAYQQASEWQPVQESVLSYMTEQANKDNKFSKQKGQFVDRGFKKVKNYNHWMIVNE